jgi:hypothetical protein
LLDLTAKQRKSCSAISIASDSRRHAQGNGVACLSGHQRDLMSVV